MFFSYFNLDIMNFKALFFHQKKKVFRIETLKNNSNEDSLIISAGPVDQLEDRFACTEEASGSSPDRSTNTFFVERFFFGDLIYRWRI